MPCILKYYDNFLIDNIKIGCINIGAKFNGSESHENTIDLLTILGPIENQQDFPCLRN